MIAGLHARDDCELERQVEAAYLLALDNPGTDPRTLADMRCLITLLAAGGEPDPQRDAER